MKKKLFRLLALAVLTAIFAVLFSMPASAALGDVVGDSLIPFLDGQATQDPGGPGSADPNVSFTINSAGSDTVRIVLLMTVLSVLPSILLMMTCFTRIIIVFSLLRNAIGLQQTPPNQVLIGIALFLTLFIMRPVLDTVNETAYKPFSDGEITSEEFLERAKSPMREFMLKQTEMDDINLFLTLADKERPETIEGYTMDIVVPAFMTSELKRAFTIGFLLFIPFLLIDMVVASALMSMGMMMLPPVTISMPFKLMLFVLVDGWSLIIKMLVTTYHL